MAIPLVVNGVTFQYPQQFDKNWGPTLTNWSSAVTSGMLQKAGGAFTLTAETDFGAAFGLKTLYVKSEETNIAATGILRMGNASAGVVWRNAANSADLALTVNASNQLTFNGTSIGATTSLTQNHVLVGNASNQPADVAMSGDVGIVASGATTIQAGAIVDSKVSASAAIQLSKLAALSNSQLVVTNGSGVLASQSSPTLTELGYVAGVGSAIQTQINGLVPLAGGTWTGNMNAGGHKITALAVGSASGDSVAYQQLAANYGQVSSGANIARANSLTGKTITTSGGAVLILASATFTATSNTSNAFVVLDVCRGTTAINGAESWCGVPSTITNQTILPVSIVAVDTPTAGTYTYNATWTSTGTFLANTYTLFLLELHA